MFRCPMSYCLPYSKVCDGQKDCPEGEDEASCEGYICPGKISSTKTWIDYLCLL